MDIANKASEPAQYDQGEVDWSQSDTVRRIFFDKLIPNLIDLSGQTVLDIGCGEGWLCDYMHTQQADVFGIDPSAKNIKKAKSLYPELHFAQSSLDEYRPRTKYDVITAIMVLEHFLNLTESLKKINSLMSTGGKLIVIVGDFDIFTKPRRNYKIETEQIRPDEVATKTNYGEGLGILYDIIRTPKRIMDIASDSGFYTELHEPIITPNWLINEEPDYLKYKDKPLFHLLKFNKLK